MLAHLSCTIALSLCAGTTLATTQPDHQPHHQHDHDHVQGAELETVHGCWGDAHGNLEGGQFFLPKDPHAQAIIDRIESARGGIPDNRVDLVIVGDGYTASEMDTFHADAGRISDSLFRYEPFTSYENYFRITAVEVISNESGVDNDTQRTISRDTALDMSYWCGGTERLLCVNVGKAYAAAASAPDIDQVIAIANSSKYGGAGYPSNNLGTAAGGNSAAAEIAIHELGHSLGDLADEYTYGGAETYTGRELSPVDVSIYNRNEQLSRQTKWHQWLDASMTGFDGPISSYEGGNYSVFGVFRPSNNSMMRSLGREFNLVSAEQLLKEIYREVSPIDDGTPNGASVESDGTVWVEPMQPLNHDLTVRWFVDGKQLLSAFGQTTLDLSTLELGAGSHELRVEVTDNTNWVRNEAMRSAFMSDSRTFTIEPCTALADLTSDGVLDFFDVSAFLDAFGEQAAMADLTGDGIYDFFDISAFLDSFASGSCN